MDGVNQARGIYMISVVAQNLAMHPQTLRKYERAGFITPLRMGTLRTYSDEDVARLRLIKHFVENLGLNLAGVEMALGLTQRLLGLRKQLSSQLEESPALAASIRDIDESLEGMGLRVVHQNTTAPGTPLNPPEEGWFQVRSDESIEFTQAVQDLTKQNSPNQST
jgi:MerR family transcriptional regulator/heat shock protein HspR